MTESDAKQFGDLIEARWQTTGVLTVERAWELCKPFDLDLVIAGMDILKGMMQPGHTMVDADWLGREVKRAAGMRVDGIGAHQAYERTSKYLAQCRADAESAEQQRQATDAMHLLPDEVKRLWDICAAKYDATWNLFSATAKARLMKIEAAL